MRVIALSLMIAAILLPELGWPQCSPCYDIALFGDAACSTCNVEIPAGQSADVYIVGQAIMGIIGAEFRVIGLPPDWTYIGSPSPEAGFALGDPLGNGTNIGFSRGLTGTCILFYRVTITATSAVQNLALSVTRHNTPSNPNFACPHVVIDCGQCNWKVCVPGRGMSINAGQDCSVATLPSTWSAMKSLYAN